jgi:hypothetical protein
VDSDDLDCHNDQLTEALQSGDETSLRAMVSDLVTIVDWSEAERIIDDLRVDAPTAKRLADVRYWIVEEQDEDPQG